MSRRRIGRHLTGGTEGEEERRAREEREAILEAWSCWATGVAIVAVRESGRAGGRVHGLTVSAFVPLSLDPPLALVSLGPNAAALPYLEPGVEYAISILRGEQRAIASRFADTLPVGPSPFAPDGPPGVDGARAVLVCRVEDMLRRGDHTLVIGRVEHASVGEPGAALVYHRRQYHGVG